MRNFFLTNRFFYTIGCLIILVMFSYSFPFLMIIFKTGIILFLVLCSLDATVLYSRKNPVQASRSIAPLLSLGDDNPITLLIMNGSGTNLEMELIDELPEQFQQRNFRIVVSLRPEESHQEMYTLRPLSRGSYEFGRLHIFINTRLGLVRRRTTHMSGMVVPAYPSLIQMKKYELKAFARMAVEYGVKKVRRIGHSYEFDHIKQYVRGDDYRSINWRATGRRTQVMVNQYDDEKSQQVYCIIDKSRVMHMPFYGLSLLDYAVNASLVISNIVLEKHDKAGLITFSDSSKTMLRAERSKLQLKKILEALYVEKETSVEANYENLYRNVRHLINGRSLIFLYTNFESTYALERVLPQLRKMNAQHLLVVILFENTEVLKATSVSAETLEDVYRQITAENYTLIKTQLAQMLRQHGILSLLTRPENLTVGTINKYLELKSRGMI